MLENDHRSDDRFIILTVGNRKTALQSADIPVIHHTCIHCDIMSDLY